MRRIAKLLAVFLFFSMAAFSQKITVSGKVTDAATKQGLQGVSVRIQGTTKGAVTGQEGAFTIAAESNGTLEVSYIGYTMQLIKINGRTTIDIAMESSVSDLGQIVLVGTRGAGRIKTETPVPVDVINVNQAGQTTAKTDLTSLLNMAAPSFNYNKQSGSDGADAIDLATLRGLGPDQTLVLINGKRRHQTAFVALFGTRGRGNSGTDLNAIPESSIDRVEILRDGASAQYGSDAIAGVINIILKKDVKKLSVNMGWAGYYDTKYNALESVAKDEYITGHKIDGNTGKIGINYGLPIGKNNGFINFSGNFLTQQKTFRQAADTNMTSNKDALPVNTGRRAFGDASVTSGGGMVNMEIPLAHTKTTFYAFGGYNAKSSEAYAYSRNFSGRPWRFPVNSNDEVIFVPDIMHYAEPGNNSSEIFYNPLINVKISDLSGAVGFRGTLGDGWDWDISNTLGRNNFHYYGDKTFNASLGEAGINKNHFDDGGFNFLQNTANADISKHFADVAKGFTLSFGGEYRYERYSIYAGEEASYKNYDPTRVIYTADGGDSSVVGAGAQGFPGFQPSDEVVATRNVFGAYVDGELDVTDKWLIGSAARFENYSDFGSLATFKFDSRYKITHNFNLRGSLSTGFRAPSLAQINFSNTFTNVQGGKIFEVKIAPNTSPITKAAGIPELKQEKSFNASFGFSWKPVKALTITIDGYYVKIKDRVVLSGQFDNSVEALAPILNQLSVSQAQFYANAVNTSNYGIDMVVNYSKNWGKNSFKVLFAGNIQHMKIDKINIPAALNDTFTHQQAFYSEREQKFLLASAPKAKLNLNLEYGFDKFAIGTHFTSYGAVKLLGYGYETTYPPQVALDANGDLVKEQFNYKSKIATDLYASYKFSKALTAFIGSDNIFNVHPDFGIVKGARNESYDGEAGGAWDPVQMGFNGRRLFAKIALNL